jgi:hypothetical protein
MKIHFMETKKKKEACRVFTISSMGVIKLIKIEPTKYLDTVQKAVGNIVEGVDILYVDRRLVEQEKKFRNNSTFADYHFVCYCNANGRSEKLKVNKHAKKYGETALWFPVGNLVVAVENEKSQALVDVDVLSKDVWEALTEFQEALQKDR